MTGKTVLGKNVPRLLLCVALIRDAVLLVVGRNQAVLDRGGDLAVFLDN